MTEPQPTSDIYGILSNRSLSSILVLPTYTGGWTLPHIHLPDKRLWLAEVRLVSGEMSKLLAADLTVLRNLYAGYSEDRTHVDLIYELENHTAEWPLPLDAKWIDRSALQTLTLSHPEHSTVIEAVLHETETNLIPKLRTPWARPGWFAAASAWMSDQLAAQNFTLTAPVEQLKSWGISCLLKAPTDR
jgi:hypothetical protein